MVSFFCIFFLFPQTQSNKQSLHPFSIYQKTKISQSKEDNGEKRKVEVKLKEWQIHYNILNSTLKRKKKTTIEEKVYLEDFTQL
jgi:hypothetical protein